MGAHDQWNCELTQEFTALIVSLKQYDYNLVPSLKIKTKKEIDDILEKSEDWQQKLK